MKMLSEERLRELLSKAYDAGFRESARWARRDDLQSDIGSPAFNNVRKPVVEGLMHACDRDEVHPTHTDESDWSFNPACGCNRCFSESYRR